MTGAGSIPEASAQASSDSPIGSAPPPLTPPVGSAAKEYLIDGCYNNSKLDYRSPHWDISQERVFMETLLNQRFNFFLLFFSIVLAGAINARSDIYISATVCTVGLVICCLVRQAIDRASHKLDLIFQELSSDPYHPYTYIDIKAGRRGTKRHIIYRRVPTFCISILLFSSIICWAAWLQKTATCS